MNLLIGADPELFLKENGVYHSGYGIIPGTKAKPFPVTDGAVQVDGMALEFNITPAATSGAFIQSVHTVMHELEKMIPKQFTLDISPVAEFSPEHMEKQPKEAKELGCDPDFDAYTEKPNPRPAQHPTMRTAAGHIHLGWCEGRDPHSEKHFMSCCMLARQMDIFLGLPSVILDPDTKRKEMYGKAGAFRPKPYGMEYRVMSNFWLKDDKLMQLVFRNAQNGFNSLVRDGKVLFGSPIGEKNIVRKIINTNDVPNARSYCRVYGIGWE